MTTTTTAPKGGGAVKARCILVRRNGNEISIELIKMEKCLKLWIGAGTGNSGNGESEESAGTAANGHRSLGCLVLAMLPPNNRSSLSKLPICTTLYTSSRGVSDICEGLAQRIAIRFAPLQIYLSIDPALSALVPSKDFDSLEKAVYEYLGEIVNSSK